ncbi:MAG: hypothetical protein EDX89_14950 [Acidobacteria bacterium]|nr:MAG: hypothetical protein EDX89_14950 [Acidobacteriota bacterium]
MDALGRLLRAGRRPREEAAQAPRRFLFLVPSRAEGERSARLCADLAREAAAGAGAGQEAVRLVVLDGGDASAAAAVARSGAEVLVKEPPGPHKGAVLEWAVATVDRDRPGFLDSFDAVVVLDADLRLPAGWLAELKVPPGAEAFQCPVRGDGPPPPGAARAEAFSLAAALRVDDPGRDAAGLPVRLRGKAMGFSPRAFRLGPARATRTTAEDTEATLLLLEAGIRVRSLPGPEALEERAAPGRLAGARARWLGGHLALLLRRPRLIAGLLARRPRAALSLLLDVYLRPRALTLALVSGVLAASGVLWAASAVQGRGPGLLPGAAALGATALGAEALHARRARRVLGVTPEVPPVTASDLARMAAVWTRAAARGLLSPGAWHRGRDAGSG